MATKAKVRKPNTGIVFNPARGLSVSRPSTRTAARKANPVRRATSVATNPRKRRTKRRRNPASTFGGSLMRNPGGGVLVGALTAGVGLAFVDLLLARVVPGGTPTIQVASKVAAGFIIQQFGGRVPILGKYKDGITFVLWALAAKQLADIYLVPTVRSTFTSLTAQAGQFLNPAAVTPAATTSGIVYGGRTLARH